MKNINGNIIFDKRPGIISSASVVGKKEAEGPLGDSFDRVIRDSYAGKDTFEQAESELMNIAVGTALEKCMLSNSDIDMAFCGDLLNQCVASSFAMRRSSIPYAGVYGACSTMALSMIMAAIAVDGGAAKRAVCAVSSHYCTAERQYRFPLEYGSQRTPTAQWTVTGAGACILGAADAARDDLKRENTDQKTDKNAGGNSSVDKNVPDRDTAGQTAAKDNGASLSSPLPQSASGAAAASAAGAPSGTDAAAYTPHIASARLGRIVDYDVTDQNNMGAAMAPAAADTIAAYLNSTQTDPYDYDMIFTGDLGHVGSRLLRDLLGEQGIDLGTRHSDCGAMIFHEEQDVHAGGSGCGCCASVLCGHILNGMRSGMYRNILFVPTGALLSPTTVLQKQTIPSVAHLVNIRVS